MTDQDQDQTDSKDTPEAPESCMPCRGSGKIVSALDGAMNTVQCPWCNGTGVKTAEVDAQAHWPASQEGKTPAENAPETD